VALYLVIALRLPGSNLSELLRVVLLVATVVFAIRYGWRGALLSTLATSAVIALEDHFGQPAYNPIRMQAYLGITGMMGLLLGASMDNLRQQAGTLREARERSDQLARDLYLAAARNLYTEERERRRLASELHDEFGQNLTALQTHLKLAERDFEAAGRPAMLAPLFDLTGAMRQNISGVLESLRPAALDQMGLYAAIERGAVRRLAEDAGLEFETLLEGDARLLGGFNDTQLIAAYRLVQEAVTNVVRHARASHCSVRLRAEERGHMLWLFIDVRDDGIGGADCFLQGRGLTNMRDRVLALGGRLHVAELRPGSRIHALLLQRAP
jgi:two-component system sensor histidine kinase UhpB